MRGGRAQLAAQGAADFYLTGDPRITYWKTTFRRHTLFATESIAQPFLETPGFGRTCRCVLGRHGDMVGAAWLEIRLPDLWTYAILPAPPGGQSSQNVGLRWVNSVGHAMIRSVRLRVGDAVLDEHPGDWLDVEAELSEAEEKRRTGLETMVGKRAEADFYSGLDLVQREGSRARTYYVPLKFCYNRSPGLYLPLAALGAQEVSYEFDFSSYVDCVTTRDAAVPVQALASLVDGSAPTALITLWAEYVMLDQAERLRLIERPRDLLVQRLLYTDHAVRATAAGSGSAARYDMGAFTGPVRELVWAYRDARRSAGDRLQYAALPPAGAVVPNPLIPTNVAQPISLIRTSNMRTSYLNSTSDVFLQQFMYGPISSAVEGPESWRHPGNVVFDSGEIGPGSWLGPLQLPFPVTISGITYGHAFVDTNTSQVLFWKDGLPAPTINSVQGCALRLRLGQMTSALRRLYIVLTDDDDAVTTDPTNTLYPDFQTTSAITKGNGFVFRLETEYPYQVEVTIWPFANTSLNSVFRFAVRQNMTFQLLDLDGSDLQNLTTTTRRVWYFYPSPTQVVGSNLISVSSSNPNLRSVRLNSKLRLLGSTYENVLLRYDNGNLTVRFGNDSAESPWSPTLAFRAPVIVPAMSILPTVALGSQFTGPVSQDAAVTVVTLRVNTSFYMALCFGAGFIRMFGPSATNRAYTWVDKGLSYSSTPPSTTEVDITPRYTDFFTSGSVFFDGNLRFAPRPPQYFRLTEPYRRHRRAPDKHVYCHSFALRPEDDAPSGHANFSVLRNPSLHLQHPPGLPAGTMRVYARTHNVLRVRGGTAQLLFTG